MRKIAYIYPVYLRTGNTLPNIYIERFCNALQGNFDFVNAGYPSNKGILDIIRFLPEIRFVFLNWIEDLPDKRGGLLQSAFFVALVYYLKIKRIRIIWTMHNQESHYETHAWFKRRLFTFMLKKSDFIITHAKEGLVCFNRYNIRNHKKIRYLPHPLDQDLIDFKHIPSIDLLIWGTIIPYKGIDQFLKYLHDHRLERRYRILLAGKIKSPDYLRVIDQYCNDFIRLDNRYIPVNELKNIIATARIIVFTYKAESVLSSGALMDTLSYGATVVAPHVGAFRDMQEIGLINTYNTYEEMIITIDRILGTEQKRDHLPVMQFIGEHNWKTFSWRISEWIN